MTGNRRATVAAIAITALLAAGGCGRIREHKGYIADEVLIQSIQPGVDNRQSVASTLGRPTFESQINQPGEPAVWYYFSRDTRQLAFASPRPVQQTILAIRFDAAGNVVSIDRAGLEQVASIEPFGEQTPTVGRERSFFDELFGNIGQSGAIGQGSGTADNPTGGN
ncbi:MAG: outer membrane protein assembly factor BamE [Sphingomonadaceae bacterium]|nr:outer membrane protein assembly factor BamE [Sphingomonadaceae bacterium]